MSQNNYRISKQAIHDLNSIWFYTYNHWSKEQADFYYELLIEQIEFIANNYLTGKSAEQTRQNYRFVKVKSHLIFYKKSNNDVVEIVRILHNRMDIKNRLK